MIEFWWLWVAAGGGVAVGMFLFALMTVASHDSHAEVIPQSASDALT